MKNVQSKFVMVGDIRTHYYEAGEGEPLVLLHSGEFGGSAEFSWEHNLEGLSNNFHVYAPDWLGFGKTDKLFDFENMFVRRINHLKRFLETVCVKEAHFIGNSMGGGILINMAARETPDLAIKKIVLVSSGGFAPDNEHREILNSYDCTKEHMRNILKTLFYDEKYINDDEYLERRYRASVQKGAWEAIAAARFRSPEAVPGERKRAADNRLIKAPTLIVAGKQDPLRLSGYAEELQSEIPGSRLKIFDQAKHCPHIEHAEEFNRLVIEFLRSDS